MIKRFGFTGRAAFIAAASALALATPIVTAIPAALAVEVSEPPAFVPLSVTQPTNLKVGSPRNEVQRLTVNATSGSYRLEGASNQCVVYGLEITRPIAYNATALEVQEAITNEQKSYCFGEEEHHVVSVVEESPGVYIITEQESEPPLEDFGQGFRAIGNRPERLFAALTEGLQGTATVTEVTHGQYEPAFDLSVTDVGGSTDGSPIKLEDTLPSGITATRIEAYDTYRNEVTPVECSPHPQTESPLICTYNHEMITGDTLVVNVYVKEGNPAGTYQNVLTVSGGGASTVTIAPNFTVSDACALWAGTE